MGDLAGDSAAFSCGRPSRRCAPLERHFLTTFADPSTFPSAFDASAGHTSPAGTGDAAVTTAPEEPTPTAAADLAAADAAVTVEVTPRRSRPASPPSGCPSRWSGRSTGRASPRRSRSSRPPLPDALAGRDVLGRGRTGSGKTLAFGLPLLARLAERSRARPLRPLALVLVPTRELAMQVTDALLPLGKAVGVCLKTAVGGVSFDRQIDALRRGVEVVVATPGRLDDLIDRGDCRLDDVEVTVLDEADQMADMGFLPQVTELLAQDARRRPAAAVLGHPGRRRRHAGQPVPDRPGHPLDRPGHRRGHHDGPPRAARSRRTTSSP